MTKPKSCKYVQYFKRWEKKKETFSTPQSLTLHAWSIKRQNSYFLSFFFKKKSWDSSILVFENHILPKVKNSGLGIVVSDVS